MMRRRFIFFLTSVLLLPFCPMGGGRLHAQGIDPVLAGMILLYTNKAENEYKQQEKMMLLESTGHIWTKEEVEGTTDIQKEFNNYLDAFHGIITYAAEVYGFYHEIDKLISNLGMFNEMLGDHPSHAVAVALSSNRNKLYRDLIMNSVDIVNDVRQVCMSNNKMTEQERLEVIFGIRPKLKSMNKRLQRLTRVVKYTSMGDVWAEIDMSARSGADKLNIAQQCMERWKRNSKAPSRTF